jgi:hypothetical protein
MLVHMGTKKEIYYGSKTARQLIDEKGLVGKKGQMAFDQTGVFKLRKSGLLPMNERIMNAKEHTDVHDLRVYDRLFGDWWDAKDHVGKNLYFRTGLYGVYKKGFEINPDIELGSEVLLIDSETGADYKFHVPDVSHPADKNKSLRQATGMAVFDLDALDYDEERRIVSARSSFDPQTQLKMVGIIKPGDVAILNVDTLRGMSTTHTAGIAYSEWFAEKSDGFHGSIEVFFELIENCGLHHCHPCLGGLYIGGSDWSEASNIIAISR